MEPLTNLNTTFGTIVATRDRLNRRLSEGVGELGHFVSGRMLERRSEQLKGLAIRRSIRRYHPALSGYAVPVKARSLAA